MFTNPVGLAKLVGLYKVEYGMILTGAFLATLPILAILLAGRNMLLINLTTGAIKDETRSMEQALSAQVMRQKLETWPASRQLHRQSHPHAHRRWR